MFDTTGQGAPLQSDEKNRYNFTTADGTGTKEAHPETMASERVAGAFGTVQPCPEHGLSSLIADPITTQADVPEGRLAAMLRRAPGGKNWRSFYGPAKHFFAVKMCTGAHSKQEIKEPAPLQSDQKNHNTTPQRNKRI